MTQVYGQYALRNSGAATPYGRQKPSKEVLMGGELIGLLAVFSIFFVPITALAFILTTRFALKPLVETLAKALRESGHAHPPELFPHMQELAEQVESLRGEVRELKELQDFDRKLLGANSAPNGDFSP
jgi:hypothetical protein